MKKSDGKNPGPSNIFGIQQDNEFKWPVNQRESCLKPE